MIALRLLAISALIGLATATAFADDPRAQFRLERGEPHVGMPFTLELIVEGFDETPAPELPKLALANATATPLGATPNVSRSIQIVNGRRSDTSRVTWVLRWKIEVTKEGTFRVPATTVTQGAKKATAQPGEVAVGVIAIADDMKISLDLPNRPVFVGETVPVTMTWLFRREPQEPNVQMPILASDAFTVSAPPPPQQRNAALTLSGGQKDLQVGYKLDKVTANGVELNRLQATFFAAPRKVGKVEVPPASVVAQLAVGRSDFFGNAPSRIFRAVDVPRILEVKALPESDRPPHFAGAVGDQFSIEVRTSRSVVSLGEPVEMNVTIKSNQPLDTLSLGKLEGEGRLPKDKFSVPGDAPTGELSDEGKTKKFVVSAQVIGPATEVPALAFSYFDPTKSTYQTIHSEPIALSVKGGAIVGAGDVVAIAPTKRGSNAQVAAPADDSALVNADLALSTIGSVDARPLGGTVLWILVGLLYALPLVMFAARSWQLRTKGQREDAAEVRAARRKVEELLDQAGDRPARDVAGPLGAALRELARVLDRTDLGDAGLLATLETESFAPSAASLPLSADVRSDAAGLLRRWLADARKPTKRASSVAAIVLASLALASPDALAAPLDDGRFAYQQAMELTSDASARKAAFARAATALGEAASALPDRPELLTDWGNAALGAGDVATATLAYRRALALDGSNARARHNLAFVRGRHADMFRPSASSATDTLLFFHTWPRARKLIVGAAAFAIAVLLLVPWATRRRGLTGLAAIPFAIWVAMIASVILERDTADDAVVMDDVVIRAADSAGAPAALSQPLPRGVEVTLLERRDAWTRIEIANGTTGWVPTGSVERVSR